MSESSSVVAFLLIHNANRYGTDVYLHLNRLSSSSEPLQ